MTSNFCFCLLCDFQSDDMSDVARHVADEHSQEQPFGVINSEGVLYINDTRINLVGLLLTALGDELTRNTSPATAVHVTGDIIIIDHEDGQVTTVDLTTFVDQDHVKRFVLHNWQGVLLRHVEPAVNSDILGRHAHNWLQQNRRQVFADLLHKLDVLSRVLEARGPLNQDMADLLWQDTTVVESMLAPTFPGTEDLNLVLDWWLDDLTPKNTRVPISEESWKELALVAGRAWTTIRDRYYGSYQTYLLKKAINDAKRKGTPLEDELNRLKYYRP